MLPTSVSSIRAVGVSRTMRELKFAYVVIFFYIFVQYWEQKIHQIIDEQRVMSAFISSEFELEGLGVTFTW